MDERREGQDDSFKPDNTDENGQYIVGKNRPPEHGKFRKNDGRRRGRRKKGTKNLATDFTEELSSKVTMKVDGKPRRVTRQRAIMMRLMDNASRGQNAAINTIMAYAEKFGIHVELKEDEKPKDDFPYMKDLTDQEFELLELLLQKASGQSLREDSDGKLYHDGHPLAYLEDPEDPRNYKLIENAEGVIWKRFDSSCFTDYIFEVPNRAYHSAALPRQDCDPKGMEKTP
ncbi:MAG: DUF5681 domain-containing protein [Sphingomonadaceae bacterium]